MKNEPFNVTVRKTRKAAKLTGAALARQLGRKESWLSLWECGLRHTMSRDVALKVANVLGLDEDTCVVAAGHLPADVERKVQADPHGICELIRLGLRASKQ